MCRSNVKGYYQVMSNAYLPTNINARRNAQCNASNDSSYLLGFDGGDLIFLLLKVRGL